MGPRDGQSRGWANHKQGTGHLPHAPEENGAGERRRQRGRLDAPERAGGAGRPARAEPVRDRCIGSTPSRRRELAAPDSSGP